MRLTPFWALRNCAASNTKAVLNSPRKDVFIFNSQMVMGQR
jgi:hypothetical protein